MINEQINIAIAELDGWTLRHIPKGKYNQDQYRIFKDNVELGGFYPANGWRNCFLLFGVPLYPESYDAIIPVIQRQDTKTRTQIVLQLSVAQNKPARCFEFLDSTPLQLCIALLKAKGLYDS